MSQDNFNVLDADTLMDECIIAKKIYGRCKQQDCLKPVDADTPTDGSDFIQIGSSIYTGDGVLTDSATPPVVDAIDGDIATGETILLTEAVRSIDVVDPFTTTINVTSINPPGPFSMPGFYDVTIQYTFNYNLQLRDASNNIITVSVDGADATLIPASTTYTKIVSLEGGFVDCNSTVTIFDSGTAIPATGDTPAIPATSITNTGNLPNVYVQAIASPLIARVGRYVSPTTPTDIEFHADVVIGLFTIIELYRLSNLCVTSSGPVEVPQCQPSITTDPCEGFNQLLFPFDDFDPPYKQC